MDALQVSAAPEAEVASVASLVPLPLVSTLALLCAPQVTVGFVVSATVTLKVQVDALLLPSVAVAVIACVPIAKVVAAEVTAVPVASAYAMERVLVA